MQAETVARLANFSNIVGIKDACGDATRVKAIKDALTGSAWDEFFILSGEDAQTLEMMSLGAVGTISVTANVLPALMAEFCSSYLAGDHARAQELDNRLQPVHDVLFVESSPTPTKWILSELGRMQGGIRLPLIPLSNQHHENVRNAVVTAGAAK